VLFPVIGQVLCLKTGTETLSEILWLFKNYTVDKIQEEEFLPVAQS
jgi:hypothetical protein